MSALRTVKLALPFAAALALLAGCSSTSSAAVGNTAATSSPAHSSPGPTTTASASVSSSAVPSSPAAGTPVAAPSGTPPPSGTTVYFAESGDVNGTVVYEPACRSGCELSGDGTTGLWNMTWPAWTGTEAVGTGTEKLDDCNPNCAAGKLYSVPVKVTFSKPAKACGTGGTRLYWTSMSFTWPDGLPSVFSGQNAPSNPFTYPEPRGTAACS
jgi:hypothetical protein